VVPVLVALFVVVPIIELALIVQASHAFGFLNTLVVLVAMSVAGAWLMKREGLGIVRRVQLQLQRGQVPTREVVDGFLVLLGGALLLTPGFFTDVFGLALLLPPVRAVLRPVLVRRFRGRVVSYRSGGTVHDARSWDEPTDGRGQLGP
jgi:UPF0716 protein FxsA